MHINNYRASAFVVYFLCAFTLHVFALPKIRPGNILGLPDAILTVDREDVSIKSKSLLSQEGILQNYDILYGSLALPEPLHIDLSGYVLAPEAKHFLFLLKIHGDNPVLLDNYCSVIGYNSDLSQIKARVNGGASLLSILEQLLLQEESSECAMEQSYAIGAYNNRISEGSIYWHHLSSRLSKIKNNDLILAYLNIGVHCDKSAISEVLKHSDVLLFAEANPSPSRTLLLDSLVISARNLSAPDTASDLIKLVSVIPIKESSFVLTELAPYLNVSNASSIVALLSRSKEPAMQYSCVQSLYYIYGQKSNIPTIDNFEKNPTIYLNECNRLLDSNHIPH